MTTTTATGRASAIAPAWVRPFLVLMVVAIPLVLSIGTIRLLMTETFLRFQYSQPDFPPDIGGWSQEDRFQLARVAVHYLAESQPLSVLANQQKPEGGALYNQRELRHMNDVQRLANALFTVAIIAGLALVVGAIVLAFRSETRPLLADALWRGSLLTIALLLIIVVLNLFSWEFLFVGFHRLFFEGDTWIFYSTDSLIRQFPEIFWFRVALFIGLGTLLAALVVGGIAWLWRRRLALPQDHAG